MAGPGLYANIHAKRKRGGKMRKKGAKGAPKASDFKRAKKKLNQKTDTPMAEDRRATLKGGGICKKGMNRKAIGKNS